MSALNHRVNIPIVIFFQRSVFNMSNIVLSSPDAALNLNILGITHNESDVVCWLQTKGRESVSALTYRFHSILMTWYSAPRLALYYSFRAVWISWSSWYQGSNWSEPQGECDANWPPARRRKLLGIPQARRASFDGGANGSGATRSLVVQ